jgi:hypothetical protein
MVRHKDHIFLQNRDKINIKESTLPAMTDVRHPNRSIEKYMQLSTTERRSDSYRCYCYVQFVHIWPEP